MTSGLWPTGHYVLPEYSTWHHYLFAGVDLHNTVCPIVFVCCIPMLSCNCKPCSSLQDSDQYGCWHPLCSIHHRSCWVGFSSSPAEDSHCYCSSAWCCCTLHIFQTEKLSTSWSC